MAQNYEFSIPAHPSIYQAQDRDLKIYLAEPDAGVNAETGLLLLLAGFEGMAKAKVYQKMRRQFADEYNLVTIQCDYFGHEFMGKLTHYEPEDIAKLRQIYTPEDLQALRQADDFVAKLIELAPKYQGYMPKLIGKFPNENPTNFNDMGIMQALDNVSAVLAVMRILEDNQLIFNSNKIMIYGHSHGAYLGYLCNALAPHLFSHLIDNSAWTFPQYLKPMHIVGTFGEDTTLHAVCESAYFATTQHCDREFLSLPYLYRQFENQCQIIGYYGVDDELQPLQDKLAFAQQVAHMDLRVVDASMLGEVFATTKHGLDADFLKMFALVMPEISPRVSAPPPQEIVTYTTSSARYVLDYRRGLPTLTMRRMI